jgi:hypothetical protein
MMPPQLGEGNIGGGEYLKKKAVCSNRKRGKFEFESSTFTMQMAT